MARARYIWHQGRWIDATEYRFSRRPVNRSDTLATPSVMGDISPHRNVATGEMVTSRSRHRDIMREHGLVEIGNERLPPRPSYEPQHVEQDVKEAYDYLRDGGTPASAEHEMIPEE